MFFMFLLNPYEKLDCFLNLQPVTGQVATDRIGPAQTLQVGQAGQSSRAFGQGCKWECGQGQDIQRHPNIRLLFADSLFDKHQIHVCHLH